MQAQNAPHRTAPFQQSCKFTVGQVVEHKLFGYLGVIFDIDPVFMLSDEWYEQQARSCPPQNQPWYHVLVHNGIQSSYVAERNLQALSKPEQINHPALGEYFQSFNGQHYAVFQKAN